MAALGSKAADNETMTASATKVRRKEAASAPAPAVRAPAAVERPVAAVTTIIQFGIPVARIEFLDDLSPQNIASRMLGLGDECDAIGVVAGTILGARLLRQIPETMFRKVVAIVLAILGMALLLRAR